MPLTTDDFLQAVGNAGLCPGFFTDTHWEIRGGDQLVRCWPHAIEGFRYQADGEKAQIGTLDEAIALAKTPRPRVAAERPQVGLIRRFWQWIW